jgi:hypothetical protein
LRAKRDRREAQQAGARWKQEHEQEHQTRHAEQQRARWHTTKTTAETGQPNQLTLILTSTLRPASGRWSTTCCKPDEASEVSEERGARNRDNEGRRRHMCRAAVIAATPGRTQQMHSRTRHRARVMTRQTHTRGTPATQRSQAHADNHQPILT